MLSIVKKVPALTLTEAEVVSQLPALARALPVFSSSWLTASEVYDQLPALAGFGDD